MTPWPGTCDWLVSSASQNTASQHSRTSTKTESLGRERRSQLLKTFPKCINQSSVSNTFSPQREIRLCFGFKVARSHIQPPDAEEHTHPFYWQHTDTSKITSKSCFTFQTWGFYGNQLPARQIFKLQPTRREFLGRVLMGPIQEWSEGCGLKTHCDNCSQSDTATW